MPEYQDEVKHKLNDVTGVVIATYYVGNIEYFDVRADDIIYYATPAANWETTSKEEDR